MASLGGRRFAAVFVALLALGIAASYSNSLGIGFYFDDLYGIHNNPTFRSLRATALEAAGKRAEARPLWEKMLQMAEAGKDIETADKARARLHSTP